MTRVTPSHSPQRCLLGVLTALAGALGSVVGAPMPLSAWLVLAGLALVWLGVDAGGRRRRESAALAARDRAESARRAADARSLELVRDLGVDFVRGFRIGRPAPLARRPVERKPANRRAVRTALLNTLPR